MIRGSHHLAAVSRRRFPLPSARSILVAVVALLLVVRTVAAGDSAIAARDASSGSSQLQEEPAPRILSFELNGGSPETTSRELTLTASFDHRPVSYRVAEGGELASAPWLRVPEGRFQVGFTLARPSQAAPFGTRLVSLQVKSGADETSTSAPSERDIVLAPARTRSYVLAGAEAARFVEEARRRGAQFVFSVTSADPVEFAAALCGETDGTRPAPGRGTPDLEPDSSDHYLERARFDVFQGVDFNPFWQLKDVTVGNILYRPVKPRIRTSGRRMSRTPQSVSFEPHLEQRVVFASREMQLTAPPTEVLRQVRDRLHGVDPGSILPALPPTIDCVRPGKTVVFSLTLEGPDDDGETFDPVELALAPYSGPSPPRP